MKIDKVASVAFSMPLTNPAYPRGAYRFFDREYMVIRSRTNPELLHAVVPSRWSLTGR